MFRQFFSPKDVNVQLYFIDHSIILFSRDTIKYPLPYTKCPGLIGDRSSPAEVANTVIRAFDLCKHHRFNFNSPKHHHQKMVEEFMAEMDRFRASGGLSERNFHKQLGLIDIRKSQGKYRIWPHKRAHRRYAFEGACRFEDRTELLESSGPISLGEELLKTMDDISTPAGTVVL